MFPTLNTFTESVFIFFGGVIVETPGPELPHEKVTAIPAASTALRVETYIDVHCCAPLTFGSCHEQLITSGMSIVAEFESGSIAHWYAAMFIDGYDAPGQSVIPAAIHFASGATPTVSPLAVFLPHMIPIV
ncbi:MAG: hypothetical protein HGGPFJEG_03045 [Ignavibacteria bacterium]|nr:hypothetical protein [Ignavibacteria bacterium]